MHILLIHQAFVSPEEAGGTRHYEFAKRCVDQNHDFTIVASDLSYLSGKCNVQGRKLLTKQTLEGVRVLRAYTYSSLHRSFLWRVFSFLSFMVTSVLGAFRASQVDVVIGTSPPIFQAVSAWLVAKVRKKPFLLEIRDLWPDFAIDMGVLRNTFLIRLSRWLENFLYNQSKHIVVNSPAYRKYLIDKGLAPQKVSLIPNGADPGMFDRQPNGKSFREKWKLDGNFVVTYAGALGMANDITTIIGAAASLREFSKITFMIIGDGKERRNLEEMTKRLKLSNVIFSGSHPKSEIPEILAASDACAATLQDIPMFKTTYPNKVFDYMAAGRPTILAIDGVIREVIEAAGGGVFVPPGNSDALANAILSLANDRISADNMGKAAREYVMRHFDRKQQAQSFIELVSALAANGARQ